MLKQSVKFFQGKTVLLKQGRGDSFFGNTAGGTPALEKHCLDFLASGDIEDLSGTADESIGNICPVSANDPGPTLQHGGAVAIDDIRCTAWRGQAAELLRADRDPGEFLEPRQAGWAGNDTTVIPGA